MLTGELRSQVDSIWNDFWSGGIANPLSVIEQITYLLFIKRLDELQTVEERKAATLQIPIERRIFPEGKDEKERPYADLRWSRFKSFEPREMFTVVDERVFPFLRTLGGEGSAFGQHMKDARLGIPTPALLAKAVEKLDAIRMEDRDTKGDVYQPVDEVLVQSGRRSKRMFTTIRAGMALWARRTIRMAASAAPSLAGSRISTHQPRATASFGVPAPINRRISSPRLCPATWIR